MNKRQESDVAYGRHSLIPECCIQFYITDWDNHRTLATHYCTMVQHSDYNYVPCPKCFFRGIRQEIRICDEECGKECWKEF